MSVSARIAYIDQLVWGPGTLALLLGTGVFLTVRTRFLPWRNLGWALGSLFRREARTAGDGGVSPLSALMTALAATIGTGNIAGVATALVAGGPGALVWMELSALFGLSSKCAECLLAVKYRQRNSRGEMCGGPMYVMTRVLKMKWLAALFAGGTLCMALVAGALLQANSIADVMREGYSINPWIVGFLVAVFTSVVTIGGVKRIAAYSEWLVPIMGGVYLTIAIIVVCMNFSKVPAAIWTVLSGAFTGKAALGGAAGTTVYALFTSAINAIGLGVSRSVMSTEAGLGSAAIAASAGQTSGAVRMGLISATSVFWTVFICVLSGLVVVLAGDWQNPDVYAANLCNSAFKTVPYIGTPILTFSLIIFSFATIIGWSYYGEKALQFLIGNHGAKTWRIIYVLACAVGGGLGTAFSLGWTISPNAFEIGLSTRFVWGLTVLMMTLMTLPNIYMLWRLRRKLKTETKRNLGKLFQ